MAAPTKSELATQLRALHKSLAREKAKSTRVEGKLAETLAQQAATAEILRVISSSPADVQPVFDAIASSATRLCDATFCIVFRFDGEMITVAADAGRSPGTLDVIRAAYPSPPGRQSISARAIAERRVISIADAQKIKGYPQQAKRARAIGYRSILAVPMMRGDAAIGTINVARVEAVPFSNTQIELLKAFADQAVIAIENARLFNETREALERQTATAEILKVIASSPSEVQPVFDVIAESAMRLFGNFSAAVTRLVGDMLQLVAHTATGEENEALKKSFPRPLSSSSLTGAVARSGRPAYRSDIESDSTASPELKARARARGMRSNLIVPMLREGQVIGTISVARREPGAFTDHQIALLQTFADQAVIAIENARLFNETKEALERQTATADILRVISSSPTDTQPVFEVILDRGTKLCDAEMGILFRYENGAYHALATRIPNPEFAAIFKEPRRPGAESKTGLGRLMREKRTVHVPDTVQDAAYAEGDPMRFETVRGGMRTWLGVPLLKEGELIGAIVIYRSEPRAFGGQQISLLETFADQAVIAIENVRLFNETKEALERQTATSEILRVISSSPTDTQPVFDAIAQSGLRLFPSAAVAVALPDGNQVRAVAIATHDPALAAAWKARFPDRLSRDRMHGTAILDCRLVDVPDAEAEVHGPLAPGIRNFLASGNRAITIMPMIRGDAAIGAISVIRLVPGPLTENQIALLRTFADQAVIAIENARLFNETREALERQTATAEILKVIASSPNDVQPVFDAISRSAVKLTGGFSAAVTRIIDGVMHMVSFTSMGGSGDELLRNLFPQPVSLAKGVHGKAARTGLPAVIIDTQSEDASPELREMAKARDFRSIVAVPMIREGAVIGTISVPRREPGAFPDHHVNLLQTFADQAVIAIENVRLFNETKEALERQTATAEILKAIASSPTDVQPVFDVIVESAVRLCGARFGRVYRYDGLVIQMVAGHGLSTIGLAQVQRVFPRPAADDTIVGRVMLTRRPFFVRDVERDDTVPALSRQMIEALGTRSQVTIPMLRAGEPIGAITMGWDEPEGFDDQQVSLLQTFADQAVIAIENVRLFNETKEALERQTATSGILEVMSGSPTDVQPVFDAIVKSGARLFSGAGLAIALPVAGQVQLASIADEDPERRERWRASYPFPLTRDYMHATAILDRRAIDVPDALDPPAEWAAGIQNFIRTGYRAITITPMVRGDTAIGTVSVVRVAPGPLTDKQIAILKTFADQAVIAIENVRLFNETKEALERQTATAEILQVIGSSPTDTQPVFDAIVNSGVRLFPGAMITVARPDGGTVRAAAIAHEDTTMVAGWRERFTTPLSRDRLHAAAILDAKLIDFPDAEAEKDGPLGPGVRNFLLSGNRAVTIMPMLRGEGAIGAISVTRAVPGPLSDKQIAILRTFADQAVIAIENVRLFKELQSRTEALTKSVAQLTALGEVGQAISSTLDLETVLKTIVTRAVQLTGLDAGGIYEYDERAEEFHLRAAENMTDEIVEVLRSNPIRKGEGAVGSTAVTREPIQVTETRDESYPSRLREILVRTGRRALLAVPLLREGRIIGALAVQRNTPGPFAPEIVELLKTFATQSAMAIQNARLFREIAEKGEQLEVASRHKSDFLASMSHELRTPLNAILGFNEMILGEIYGEVPADMKEPLTDIQASGKHLLRLINNVLDLAKIEAGRMELAPQDYAVQDIVESVRSSLRPLAAEKGLEFATSVPADIPLAYGDAGRIMQCLMNLAGNALKFTREGRVEIAAELRGALLAYRVSDTGIGISKDKIDSVFAEFRQADSTIAGEYGGTGLGLSISKKFVEMHGGRIWVESEPGKGSAFLFEIPLRLDGGAAA